MAISGSGNVLLRSQVKGGRATVLFTASGYCSNVVANSTVNSDLSNSNDSVTGASISGLTWSCVGANSITIARNANTVAVPSGAGNMTAAQGWLGNSKDPTANVVITFSSVGCGVLYAEFSKLYQSGSGDVSE